MSNEAVEVEADVEAEAEAEAAKLSDKRIPFPFCRVLINFPETCFTDNIFYLTVNV